MANNLHKIEKLYNYSAPDIALVPSDSESETIIHLKQKFKDPVLLELYQSVRMLHSVLANRIEVSPSGLNAIIKKLNDIPDAPIQIDKKGKFTYYSLLKPGIEYVEKTLLPMFAVKDEEKEAFNNIYDLAAAFKDKTQEKWGEKLLAVLEEETSEDDEGFGFIKELGSYYTFGQEKAHTLLKIIVPDKDIYQKIIAYLDACNKVELKAVEEILNQWGQQNCTATYRLLDGLFGWLQGKCELPNGQEVDLWQVGQCVDRVFDWIQARVLRGITQDMNKEEAVVLFSSLGLEVHIAWYLAEKYQGLHENYRDRRES